MALGWVLLLFISIERRLKPFHGDPYSFAVRELPRPLRMTDDA
jgi:hypothetical protein